MGEVARDELALVDEVHDRLAARIPAQGPATLVHGDYRLDNMILTDSGEVAAVVDWELCTLGDPLADVGMLLVYWGAEGDTLMPLMEPATIAPGFPDREQVKRRYAERSGRDLSEIDYYVALGLWKLAIILQGVYARYSAGQYGSDDDGRQFRRPSSASRRRLQTPSGGSPSPPRPAARGRARHRPRTG